MPTGQRSAARVPSRQYQYVCDQHIAHRGSICIPQHVDTRAPSLLTAALRIFERQLTTHDAYLDGLSTLLDALILSIGPANALLLADPEHGMMLVACGDVMAMMKLKHGTPQASDIASLKSRLTIPLNTPFRFFRPPF